MKIHTEPFASAGSPVGAFRQPPASCEWRAAFTDFLEAAGQKPFFLWVAFDDPHRPYQTTQSSSRTNRSMWRCRPTWLALYERKQNGRLTDAQSPLFRSPRPEIEFYDIEEDPWELNNLAAQPDYHQAVAEHFAMLQEWKAATGDFPPERRQRAGYVDRITGVLYSLDVPPMFNQ